MASITAEYLADALVFLLKKCSLSGWQVSFQAWSGDVPVALNPTYPGYYLSRLFAKPHEEGILFLRDIPKVGQTMQEISHRIKSEDDIYWALLLHKHNIKEY